MKGKQWSINDIWRLGFDKFRLTGYLFTSFPSLFFHKDFLMDCRGWAFFTIFFLNYKIKKLPWKINDFKLIRGFHNSLLWWFFFDMTNIKVPNFFWLFCLLTLAFFLSFLQLFSFFLQSLFGFDLIIKWANAPHLIFYFFLIFDQLLLRF